MQPPTLNNSNIPSKKELYKTVLQVAWPSTVEAVFLAMVGLIDTVMVSSLGEGAVAGVGLTTQPKLIGFAIIIALSASVSAIVARRRGEVDPKGANKTLYNALGLTIIISIVISILFFLFSDTVLILMGSNEDTHYYASTYLKIIMCCMLFHAISLIINAAQRGSGNTKVVLRSNLVSNTVNLIFNWLLIGGNLGFPALGVSGAAIATVLGTIAAMVMSIHSALPNKSFVSLNSFNFFKFDLPTINTINKIAISTFAEQLFLRFGFLIFTVIAASLGTIAFAAHQVGHNIMSVSFSVADGLSVAAIALVGRSLGQGRPELAKIYGSVCQRIGLCISAFLAFIYAIFGVDIFRLFSERDEILSYGAIITNLISVIVFLQITQIIYASCLRGAGDTKFTAYVSFVFIGIVRPIASYLLCYTLGFGLIGAWASIIIDQAGRLIFNYLRFRKGDWCKIRL